MPSATIRVLNTQKPGPSLAIWLAYHHPDLFLATLRKARAAQATKKPLGWLRGLGQDDSGGTTTFFGDDGTTTVTDNITPSEPALQTITVDQSALSTLPDNLISDAADSGALSTIASGATSNGSSLGTMIGGGISGMLGALGSVASYASSPGGLNTIGGIAKSWFGAQAASAQAQTQQAVLQAQIARTATNQLAAPITYTRNAAGQLVPIYTNGSPLTKQGLANLTPSAVSVFLSQYGVWVLVAGAVVYALSRR